MKAKLLLGNTIEDLLNKTAIDKITLKRILDECGVSKQTFYRYFRDKYDLANWRFSEIYFNASSAVTPQMTFTESSICIYSGFKGKLTYLKNMYSSDDYNNLNRFMNLKLKSYFYEILKQNGFNIKNEEMIFLVDTWIYVISENTKRWVMDDCKISKETVIKTFEIAMPDCIRICFERSNFFIPNSKIYKQK
ncbi:MAG: TetR/AcrR family transcriptional regulator [Ruminococcus sp.]|nr:TetR/AcrR family transcriptional regulator [Ruminococcus sp.]